MTTRVALITGAAQGIGEAISLRLADDGIDVALLDIHTKEQQLAALANKIAGKGRQAFVVPADVSSEEDVKSAIEKTVENLGSLDIVCGAAVSDQG